MCKSTTRFFRALFAEPVRKVFPPCLPGGGGKKVFIRIFDINNQLTLATGLPEGELVPQLSSFFNGLGNTPGLPAVFAQFLQSFSFEVLYEKRTSTEQERRGFGVMDFPVYIVSTEPPTGMTESEAVGLFEAHKIPATTILMKIEMENGQEKLKAEKPDVYKTLLETIKDGAMYGLGVPGNYFEKNSGTACRKIAIIKVDRLKAKVDASILKKMFLAVFKHEVGHMFGLRHEANTLMHDSYQEGPLLNNETYTVLQFKILSMVLKDLSEH